MMQLDRVSIRRFEPSDAAAAAELLRLLTPYEPMTEARLSQYDACKPPRIAEVWWVAVRKRRVVGWASAGLHLWTGERRVGSLFVGVTPALRRQGLGGRLYDIAVAHLGTLGVERLESAAYGSAVDAPAFLKRRGFGPVQRAVLWRLEPATVAPFDLEFATRRALDGGFQVVPLRSLSDRPDAMHSLYAETLRDVPTEDAFGEVRFKEFLCYRLHDPMLDLDGSFVVMFGDLPVAYAWITLDRERRLGFNAMTGTMPAYRQRGLAKLAKAASIRWARDNDVAIVYTSNDENNASMLAINRALGYEAVEAYEIFSRVAP